MVLCLDLAWLELSNPQTGPGNAPSQQGSQASSSVSTQPSASGSSTSNRVTNNNNEVTTMVTSEVAPEEGIDETSTSATTQPSLLISESSASNPRPSTSHRSEPTLMDISDESIIELPNTEHLTTSIKPSTLSTTSHSARTVFQPSTSQRTPRAIACLIPDDSTSPQPLASTSNTPARSPARALTRTSARIPARIPTRASTRTPVRIPPARIKVEIKQEETELATTTVEEVRLVRHFGVSVDISKLEEEEKPNRANLIPNAQVTNNENCPTVHEDPQNNTDQPEPEGEDVPQEPQIDNDNPAEPNEEENNNPQQDIENVENNNGGEVGDSGNESNDYLQELPPERWPRRHPVTVAEANFVVAYLRRIYGPQVAERNENNNTDDNNTDDNNNPDDNNNTDDNNNASDNEQEPNDQEQNAAPVNVRTARPVLESDDEDDEDDEYVESQGDGYQVKDGEVTARRIMPKWLTRDPFDNRLWNFEISRFPVVRYAGHLKNWLEGNTGGDDSIHNCEWDYFSRRATELMTKYKELLAVYYKNGMSPNDRRQVCSTVAWYFPLLGQRYNEFREYKADGDEIGSKTTFSFRTITELLYKRLEYQFRYRNSWQRRYGPEKVIKKRGTSLATTERNRKRRRPNPEEAPEAPTEPEPAGTAEPTDASANDDAGSSPNPLPEEAVNAMDHSDSASSHPLPEEAADAIVHDESSSDTLLDEDYNGPINDSVPVHDATNSSDSNKDDSSNDVHYVEPTLSAPGSSSTATEHIDQPTDGIRNDQPEREVEIISDNESSMIVPSEDSIIIIDDSPNPSNDS